MAGEGYRVLYEKEHEFVNSEGVKIAFAGNNVLERDGICTLRTGVIEVEWEGKKIRTITKEAFIKAYLFSSDDGYRKGKRGRSDLDKEYMELFGIKKSDLISCSYSDLMLNKRPR